MEELLEATKGGKRVRKTPQEKLAILEFLDAGGSAEDAAARFGIARSAAAKMLKERDGTAAEPDLSSTSTAAAVAAAVTVATAAPSELGKRTRQAPTNEDLATFVQLPGASVATAATKFGLTRAEVTRALKAVAEDASTQPGAAAAALTLASAEVMSAEPLTGTSLAAGIDEHIAAVGGLASAALVLGSAEAIDGVVSDPSELTGFASRLAAAESSYAGAGDKEKASAAADEQKAAILKFVMQGGLPSAAAAKFGVPIADVAKMVQEKAAALVAISTAAMQATASSVTAAATRATAMTTATATATTTTTTTTTTSAMTSEAAANMMGVESSSSTADPPVISGNAGSAMVIDSGAVIAVTDSTSTTMSATPTATTTEPVVSSAGSSDVAMPMASTNAAPSGSIAAIAPMGEGLATATSAVAASTSALESKVSATPASTPTPARKGRRVRKTNSEKLEILAFVEKGGSQGAAAEKFGVSRTAVTKMVKEKDAICAQARSESTNSRKVLQYQHKLSIIEDMLYKWQLQVEIDSPSIKLTGDLLQSKAMEFRNKVLADYASELPDEVVLSLTDFKASNGWLHRYMQRRSIRTLPKHNDEASTPAGTSAASDRSSAERVQRIRALLTQVPPSCIWTLTEVLLRHRTTSGRPDAPINLDARAMDRLSVALAVSASGEKLRLQVVGKDEHALSLLGGAGAGTGAIDPVAAYGIHFRAQSRAWHDSFAVMECIQQMNREAKARKQMWFLVLDSSPSHVAAAHALHPSGSYRSGFTFESTVMLFLPPSAAHSSARASARAYDAQPLYQGVVQDFKRTFRFEMLQTLLQARQAWLERSAGHKNDRGAGSADSAGDLFDVHTHMTIRRAVSCLQKAWEAVAPSDVRRAWTCCAFMPPQPETRAGDAATHGDSSAAENGHASAVGPDSVPTAGQVASSEQLRELLANVAATPKLAKELGLDGLADADSDQAMEAEAVEFDGGDAGAGDELAKDDEIVLESLSLQGLLRDVPRAIEDGAKGSAAVNVGPEISGPGEACTMVARLLRFVVTRGAGSSGQELLSPADRRTARGNLLALQRVLLKARAKEQAREPAREPAHGHEHDPGTAYTV